MRVIGHTATPSGRKIVMDRTVWCRLRSDGWETGPTAVLRSLLARRDRGVPFVGCEVEIRERSMLPGDSDSVTHMLVENLDGECVLLDVVERRVLAREGA